MHLFFPVYTLFLALPMCIWATGSATNPRKFILSRDCTSMPTSIVGLEESQTKTLRIDDLESGAIIYSHDFESDALPNASSTILGQNYYAQYPLAFSCEVVIHAPLDNGRIMLTIESFFIPSSDQTCKDDFLYVFDSNTARSKAMPEAGGEQGLCLSHYPKIPVFSSKSYICIAFHTSNSPRFQFPNSEAMTPGFKIVVTAFQESQTSACPEGRFYCGSVKNAALGGIPSVINFSGGVGESRSSVRLPSTGICVSERVCCDGVFNCPDGRDEFASLCNHFQDGGPTDQDISFLGQFLSLGLTTSVSIVVAAVLFIILCLGCIICLCRRNRFNARSTNSPTAVVNTVFDGVNRTCSGELAVPHTDPSSLLNGVRKSPDDFHSQILATPTQQQQIVLPPAKSMGDLFQPHQLSPNSPMLRHFHEYPSSPQPPPPGSWNTQPICYSVAHHPQWLPQQQQQQQHQQQVHQQMPLSPQNQTQNRVSGATPSSNVPTCPQQLQQQSHLLHSTRFPYQHLETSSLVADGGIVYLGEIGSGSGSGGSRLATSSRRPRRRSGRAMDTQSSSSIGCGPSTRGAQSAEGAPRTASNSPHSVGPSWSSSRGTTANNPSANSSANVRPHHHRHHHHRRCRRQDGSGGGSSGKQSTRNHSTNSSEKIAYPVEL
uniref:CUB n=1 Tax=Echinococcus granulosus TaxID=6210 RepID=A0A068WK66_ECHGR|nr:CUB [Echinococcus granulosus]